MRHAALFALLAMTMSTAACKQHAEPAGSHEPSTPATTAATPSATTAPSAAPGAIGVTECDEFLRKWESCLATKVPEEAREQVKVALDATRDSWKRAAATPNGMSGLAEACKSASELAEMQVAAYGCTW
ncbi:MAG: hypothetical protein AB7G12_16785 [Thermoanaerobaculia bacterium]